MSNEQKSQTDIFETAFSEEELSQMSPSSLRDVGVLIKRRLAKPGTPTTEELRGMLELVEGELSHPALTAFRPSEDSRG
jgi:hypothetical protein